MLPLPSTELIAARYRLLRPLGQGGMATVYLAEDTHLEGRHVAIKLMHHASSPQHLRFRREFRVMARLHHAHVLKVYSSGMHGNVPFLVMEYVAEGSLSDNVVGAVASAAQLGQRLRWLIELSKALRYIHSCGIVHRDIKPDNVMLCRGQTRLMDFGLAHSSQHQSSLTQQGAVMGTAAYMAPEQVQGLPVDARSDLYALGCVLYWLMTGRPPFEAESFAALLLKQVRAQPEPLRLRNPMLPEGLESIAERLLAKAPAERYQAADDVVRALETLDQTLSEQSHPLGTSPLSYRTLQQVAKDSVTPVALLSPGLIGREAELETLQQHVARAAVARLEMSAGSGGSSLLQTLAQESRLAGMDVLKLEFSNYGSVPFGAWRNALALLRHEGATPHDVFTQLSHLFAEAAPSSSPSAIPDVPLDTPLDVPLDVPRDALLDASDASNEYQRMRRYAQVHHWLQRYAQDQRLLIIAKDLEQADEASMGLLSYLVRAERVGAIILAHRTPHAPAALVDGLPPSPTLRLQPLNQQGMQRYIHALLGGEVEARLTDYVCKQAAGSPRFAKEILQGLLHARHITRRLGMWEWGRQPGRLPQSIEQAFGERIAQLSTPAHTILQAAACIGQDWDFATLASLMRLESTHSSATDSDVEDGVLDAITEALHTHLLQEKPGDGYQFAHPLLRELLHNSLTPRHRRRYHQRLGDMLRKRGASAACIAEHYAEAEAPNHALPYARKVARHAAQVFANDISENYYRMALQLSDHPKASLGLRDWLALRLEFGQLLARIGRWQEAEQLYHHVQQRAQGHRTLQGKGMYLLGVLARKRGDFSAAADLLMAARVRLPNDYALISELALVYGAQGNVTAAEQLLRQGLAQAQAASDNYAMVCLQSDLGKLEETRDRYSEAIVWYAQALAQLQRITATDAKPCMHLQARIYNRQGVSYYRLGQLDHAQQALARAHDACEAIGDSSQALITTINQGLVLIERQETEAAIALYQRAALQAFRLGDAMHEALCHCNLGTLLSQQGKYAAALATFRQAEPTLARLKAPGYLVQVRLSIAEMHIAQHETAEAFAVLEDVRQSLSEALASEQPETLLDLANMEARACFVAGDFARAKHALQRLLSDQFRQACTLLTLDSHLLLCIAAFATCCPDLHRHLAAARQCAHSLGDSLAHLQLDYLHAVMQHDSLAQERCGAQLAASKERLFVRYVTYAQQQRA